MISTPPTMTIPLRTDKAGSLRVGNTRVTLDVIIYRFLQGRTPEQIHESFPTVRLPEVYSIIAYYLENRQVLDAYLKRREEEVERLRQKVEGDFPPVTRAELLARLEARNDQPED